MIALAVATHPDDIEFMMAGTLLRLKNAGCVVHMWNIANGCLGSLTESADKLSALRWEESQASAALAGATPHPPLFNDLEIFYDKPSLARVSSVLRSIRPQIILTHSPHDYMEDHQNVCRLVVTAAFSRGMPNFCTEPPHAPYHDPVRIYHAAPHGLHDGQGVRFQPDFLVDISSEIGLKRRMLSCHHSQLAWLEASQGMGAYVNEMSEMCREMAKAAGTGDFAEGWKKHPHLGFCPPDFDPLSEQLSEFIQYLKN